jgi:hypothetical protein
MHRLLAISIVLATGCVPVAEPGRSPTTGDRRLDRADPVDEQFAADETPQERSEAVPLAPMARAATAAGIHFTGVALDARTHRLVVVDQADGPGSKFRDAASAASHVGGLCAINAGFFTPEGNPLGVVVSEHGWSGTWNTSSSLGAGIWCEDRSGRMTLVRRHAFHRRAARSMRGLLQAGPMLVADGRAVGGLDDVKLAARTLIAWDGHDRWWMGRTSPCTLAALGRTLADHAPAGWKTLHALNLDGGRSSELWIAASVPGGPMMQRPEWNRVVRNHLVLVPR